MIELGGGTIIDAPIENVWEFISNLETLPRWTGVLNVEYNVPVGVGTTIEATYRLLGLHTFKITVTEWEPISRLGMKFRLGAEFHEIVTMEPIEEIKTHLTISLRGEIKGLLRIVGPLISYRARKEFSGRLTQVKHAYEASERSAVHTESPLPN
jgi:uncharacterized protein YndB with AHSA1/START domain